MINPTSENYFMPELYEKPECNQATQEKRATERQKNINLFGANYGGGENLNTVNGRIDFITEELQVLHSTENYDQEEESNLLNTLNMLKTYKKNFTASLNNQCIQ